VPVVSARFDEPLDASLVGSATLVLTAQGTSVPSAVSVSADGRSVELRPVAPLSPGATYVATLRAPLADPQGNAARLASGEPLDVLAWSFTTTDFALTAPVDGSVVPENAVFALRASGSAALGIASVEFSIDGVSLAIDSSAPFEATTVAPAATPGRTLALLAIARAASGVELARASASVRVVAGLRAERALLGVPRGGSARLRLLTGAPLAAALEVSFTASDPTRVGVPAVPLLIPAGATEASVELTGLSDGATVVLVDADGLLIPVIVSVSPLVSGQSLPTEAAPVGSAVRTIVASLGQLRLPENATRTVRMRVSETPAGASTPLTALSSDASVAALVGSPVLAAGATEAELVIATGAPGVATLTLQIGALRRELRIVVGSVRPDLAPAVSTLPIGFALAPSENATTIPLTIAPARTRTISLRLLDAPAGSATPVVVTSSDSAVAQVVGSSEISEGAIEAELVIQSGVAGDAVLFVRVGDRVFEIRVRVGTPSTSRDGSVSALPVGLVLPDGTVSLGQLTIASAQTRELTLRVLDEPASETIQFLVTSSAPGIALVLGVVEIPAGSRDLTLQIATGDAGDAVLTLRAGSEVRALNVRVGAPSAGRTSPIVAPPVGVDVETP
jgi:hypothetical protein